ncbi:GNAT family N-acetyltransferase [Bacillus sp. FJAT-42376]|uniref:GNAT family N-acetyltransferase n=1 Tax=Bacillus sp. FJAT-42376 TaxID=2014076 RepID=UPI000F4E71E4|nr:GNAT family N-acetyltransferase [Bacillus sp. FJAT-42376]AZB44120.1 GNAT family N-acetyltransferase [Bacillus sp. FJAT-42376]
MFKIRKAVKEDIKGIAEVHVTSWRTTYRNIVDAEYLNALTYEQKENQWANADLDQLFLAEDEEDRIVGFSSFGNERTEKYGFDGEIYAIYLLEEVQRKGLGSALFLNSVDDLIEKGCQSVMVWVISENPSRGFYESYFPELIAEETFTIGKGSHIEYAFGWKDIERLKSMLLQGNRV